MKTLIISGKAGSGKDTIANYMKEMLEAKYKKVLVIHYGDAVKWVLKDFFDWNGQKDEYGRHLLQYIGTDVVRNSHPSFWVGIVAGLLSAFEDKRLFDVALVPDARFENEVELTRENVKDAVSIRIERKNPDGSEWINTNLTEEQRQHPSETSLDDYEFDYVIANEEDLEVLKESAQTILEDLKLI